MYRNLVVIFALLLLSGCRLVSEKQLADLKNPPNPHMADIKKTWQQQIVPQIEKEARPAQVLLQDLQSAGSFDEACKKYGYRSQEESPCNFYVTITGTVEKINTASRSGKMIIKDDQGNSYTVQIGPIIRGTTLRDAYRGASYQDFNDQVLFGDYGKEINQQAADMLKDIKPAGGNKISVTGVFSSWDIPQTLPDVTPAKVNKS